jgi:hypothetical protein
VTGEYLLTLATKLLLKHPSLLKHPLLFSSLMEPLPPTSSSLLFVNGTNYSIHRIVITERLARFFAFVQKT